MARHRLRRRYGCASGGDDVTPVIFRVWPAREGGGVIALFPYEKERDGLIGSYEHLGQHGSADPRIVYRTRAARPDEYASLKRELEGAPFHYKLRVIKRMPRRA